MRLARLLALVGLLGCGDPPRELNPMCHPDAALTWESWGQGFVDTHCVGCHSSVIPLSQRRDAPLGVDFDTYRGVLQWAERIEVRTLLNARLDDDEILLMPPGGGVTDEELDMLEEWLQCSVFPDKAALEAR